MLEIKVRSNSMDLCLCLLVRDRQARDFYFLKARRHLRGQNLRRVLENMRNTTEKRTKSRYEPKIRTNQDTFFQYKNIDLNHAEVRKVTGVKPQHRQATFSRAMPTKKPYKMYLPRHFSMYPSTWLFDGNKETRRKVASTLPYILQK